MAVPRDDAAIGVEPGAQPSGAGGAVVVVAQVVFARADHLDRSADRLRDDRRLRRVVRQQPAAEAAAQPRHLDVHAVHGQAHGRGDDARARPLHLERTGDVAVAVAHVGGAVVRLERGVREEGELVVRLHHPRGPGKRLLDVADRAHGGSWRPRQLRELRRQRRGALVPVRAFVPLHLKRIAALERRPRRVGDDGDAGHQERRVVVSGDAHDLSHPRHLQRRRIVHARDPAAEHRALGDGGELHVGQTDVDAVERASGDDLRVVHAGTRVPSSVNALVGFQAGLAGAVRVDAAVARSPKF